MSLSRNTISILIVGAMLGWGGLGATAQDYVLPDSLPAGVTPEVVQRGYDAFHGEGLCVNCHGAKAGGLLGPSLADSEWWHAAGSYLAILRQVLVGVPQENQFSIACELHEHVVVNFPREKKKPQCANFA